MDGKDEACKNEYAPDAMWTAPSLMILLSSPEDAPSDIAALVSPEICTWIKEIKISIGS